MPPALRPITFTLLFVLTSTVALANTVVTENIFFINPDGRNYLNYSTTRSTYESYNLYLRKDQSDKDFEYIHPKNYTLDSESDEERNKLIFPDGSYATMRRDLFSQESVKRDKDGVFTYTNWDFNTRKKRSDGHFGEWTTPNNFAQYAFAWVLPDNFEVVSFDCNRQNSEKTDWVTRKNTLTWYGEEVNDIVFTIKYRDRAIQKAEDLKSDLALRQKQTEGNKNVAVDTSDQGVRLTVKSQHLFASGKAELTEEGKNVMALVADSLKGRKSEHIVVEGHTDNIKVSTALASQFPTNWELSAARSMAVVRFLQNSGINGTRLESRAFGEFRPKGDNSTEEGRAQNRRIDILIFAERHS